MTDLTDLQRRALNHGRAEGLEERERLRALHRFPPDEPDPVRVARVVFTDGPRRLVPTQEQEPK